MGMRGKLLAALAAALIVCLPGSARAAAPKGKNFVVGVVQMTDAFVYADAITALRENLEKLGYVRGENLILKRRVVLGKTKGIWDKLQLYTALKGYIQEFADSRVNLIVTVGTPATIHGAPLAREKGIPVLFIAVADPNAIPFLKEGWITGTTNFTHPETMLRLMKNTMPDVKKLAMFRSTDENAARYVELIKESAGKLGFEAQITDVDSNSDAKKFVEDLHKNRPDVILATPDTWLGRDDYVNGKYIIDEGIRKEKIFCATFISDVFELFPEDIGMSVGVGFADTGVRAAALVDQVLNGQDASSVPVSYPKGPEIRLRLDVLEKYGVSLTPDLIKLARMVGK